MVQKKKIEERRGEIGDEREEEYFRIYSLNIMK